MVLPSRLLRNSSADKRKIVVSNCDMLNPGIKVLNEIMLLVIINWMSVECNLNMTLKPSGLFLNPNLRILNSATSLKKLYCQDNFSLLANEAYKVIDISCSKEKVRCNVAS